MVASILHASDQGLASDGSAHNLMERLSFYKASTLGLGMSDQECFDLASRSRLRTFHRQDRLFMQGEPQRELFLLRSGYVKLTQLSHSGSEVLLWICGPGSVLGIRAEMNARPYSCSAHAVKPCTAWSWDHEAIAFLMARNPRLRQNMSAILMDRVHELEERFRELATENVSRRLALALVRLSKEIGSQGPKGTEISLSREEMAQMTGTTLFSISRIISQWAKQKLVLPGRQTVVIPDMRRIESLALEE